MQGRDEVSVEERIRFSWGFERKNVHYPSGPSKSVTGSNGFSWDGPCQSCSVPMILQGYVNRGFLVGASWRQKSKESRLSLEILWVLTHAYLLFTFAAKRNSWISHDIPDVVASVSHDLPAHLYPGKRCALRLLKRRAWL